MPKAETTKVAAPPGLLSGLLFFAVVLAGTGYIVLSKIQGLPALYVTLVPVLIMIAYALLLGVARIFRLRDDQSGDNLYYMGFLFTLTSLAVSLYQFSEAGSAEQIVQNFGIAIASTIAGIALRIFFNQMRRDPLEVEQTARLELAEASRKVKRELESTVLEFAYFRRATQQSLSEAVEEVSTQLKEAKERIVGQLDEFATKSSKPLEEASKKSADTIQYLSTRISDVLETAVRQISDEVGQLSMSTVLVVKSFDSIVSKLTALQTPDQVIEIKLNPMIQGLTRAVNNFGKHAEMQAKAVDANLKQTQLLADALKVLLVDARARTASTREHPGMGAPGDPTGVLGTDDVEGPEA
ncbi:MAG: hypothetical protein ACLQNV_19575 [Steroidobacteraceae bacterium]